MYIYTSSLKKLIDATAAFSNKARVKKRLHGTKCKRDARKHRRSGKSTDAGSLWNCGKLYYS